MDKEKLKQDFFGKIADFSDDYNHDVEPYSMQKIAEWWLQKIQEREKSLLKEIEGIKIDYPYPAKGQRLLLPEQIQGYNTALDSVLSLISSKI